MAYNNVIDRTGADALIPVEQVRDIIAGLPAASVAMSKFRSVRMASKTQTQPVLASLPTAYFLNGDTDLKQTTQATWGKQTITAEELAVIVPIPDAVLDDAEFDIWAEVRPLIVEALGATIDAAVLFGTNKPASWPAAIVPDAVAKGNSLVKGSVVGQDLAGDINAVMGLVEADGYDVNGFIAARTLKASLRGLRDDNGGLLFQPSLTSGTPSTLYGESIEYPMNGAFDTSVAHLVAGDFTKAIFAIRQDVTYKMLTEAVIQDGTGTIIYNLAQQDMTAMRVVMRVGFQIAKPLTRYNSGNANAYPFAVLHA